MSHSGDVTNERDWAIPRQSLPLGHPLPLDEHACSVSLPTWQSVVGYEEGWKSVTSQLKCGYPRFVYHPYIIQLMDQALKLDQALQQQQQQQQQEGSVDAPTATEELVWDCIVLPSRDSAIRCHDFLIKACGFCHGVESSPRFAKNYQGNVIMARTHRPMDQLHLLCPHNALDWIAEQATPQNKGDALSDPWYKPSAPIRILNLKAAGTFAIIFPAQTAFAIEAKSYWQHSGEIVSSRRAECALMELHTNYINNNNNNISSSPFTLQRITSCYYDASNPQQSPSIQSSDMEKMITWTLSCPNNPNLKHLAHHPSKVPIVVQTNKDGTNQNPKNNSYDTLKNYIADVTFTSPSCVFLTPSGMASIYTALRSAQRLKLLCTRHVVVDDTRAVYYKERSTQDRGNGGTAIVYGFPYLDTLKMCCRPEWVPGGVEFFGFADTQDLNQLSTWLQSRHRSKSSRSSSSSSSTIHSGEEDTPNDAGVSILLTEYPSNPLLKCPDLKALRELADQYDFALVVDDTIGNFANLDLLSSGLADAVCTSLTKLFSGRGDVIAGSIVTNPNTPIGRWMQQDLLKIENRKKRLKEEASMLFMGDAAALEANSNNFLERSHKINQTAEAFADWLKDREEVVKVFYPKYSCAEKYTSVLNTRPLPFLVEGKDSEKSMLKFHKAGFGGLMSIILQPHICQRTFYDSLNISKGPSLGTNFTLVCPYTLLAHYHELDFAMSYNVEPNLLRISVGLEDLDDLKERFSFAFESSRLYPKVPPLKNTWTNEHGNRRMFTTWSKCQNGRSFDLSMYGVKQFSWANRGVLNVGLHNDANRTRGIQRFITRSLIPTLRWLH